MSKSETKMRPEMLNSQDGDETKRLRSDRDVEVSRLRLSVKFLETKTIATDTDTQ